MVENYVVLMLQLVLGVQAIAPARMPARRAAVYARAAAYHGIKNNLDPFELVGLARNESDFNDRTIGPDGLDCGITQTRITYSRYTCQQLQNSPWIAFAEAARELSAAVESCRGRSDYDRCRLNTYNSGHRYARRGFSGRYYLRLACFAAAAREKLPFGSRCRTVQSEEQLALWIGQAGGARAHWARTPARPVPQLQVAQTLPMVPAYSDLRREGTPPWQVTILGIQVPVDNRPQIADRPARGRLRMFLRRMRGVSRRREQIRRSRHHAQRPLDLLFARRFLFLTPEESGVPRALAGQDAADGGNHAGPRTRGWAASRRGRRVG